MTIAIRRGVPRVPCSAATVSGPEPRLRQKGV
jgi:hypothetical protein